MDELQKKNLANRYKNICDEYVTLFCDAYQLQFESWVGDEAGTIGCFGDYFFEFNDVIKYSVDHNLHDWHMLIEWYDYTLFASEFGQQIPNFRSWSSGCPHLSKQEQKKLRELKESLVSAIEEYKEKY